MSETSPPTGPDGVDRGPFPTAIAPFDDAPFRVRMGLRRLDLDAWLEVDPAFGSQIAHKHALYGTHYDSVVVAMDHPKVAEAALELHELVDEYLRAHPGPHRPSGGAVSSAEWPHPIAAIGLSTQEDWCVLCRIADREDSPLVLGCGSVCFPTRWVLTEKLGLTTREIHRPVPYYDDHAGGAVDAYLDRLTVDRPVWRVNWNLCDDGALHQASVGGRASNGSGGVGVEAVGEQIWLRLERQTLRRLPRTGAIAFGIRVHHQPLGETAATPELVRRLSGALGRVPGSVLEYKGLSAHAAAILQWCRANA